MDAHRPIKTRNAYRRVVQVHVQLLSNLNTKPNIENHDCAIENMCDHPITCYKRNTNKLCHLNVPLKHRRISKYTNNNYYDWWKKEKERHSKWKKNTMNVYKLPKPEAVGLVYSVSASFLRRAQSYGLFIYVRNTCAIVFDAIRSHRAGCFWATTANTSRHSVSFFPSHSLPCSVLIFFFNCSFVTCNIYQHPPFDVFLFFSQLRSNHRQNRTHTRTSTYHNTQRLSHQHLGIWNRCSYDLSLSQPHTCHPWNTNIICSVRIWFFFFILSFIDVKIIAYLSVWPEFVMCNK